MRSFSRHSSESTAVASPSVADDATFEAAIQRSVAATSQGNKDQDALIERAIRASVAELRRTPTDGDAEAHVQRAVRASVTEAQRIQTGGTGKPPHEMGVSPYALEESLNLSLKQHASKGLRHAATVDSAEEEHLRLALVESQKTLRPTEQADAVDDGLHEALARSHLEEKIRQEKLAQMQREEEIVLEHVKRQSLVEENKANV